MRLSIQYKPMIIFYPCSCCGQFPRCCCCHSKPGDTITTWQFKKWQVCIAFYCIIETDIPLRIIIFVVSTYFLSFAAQVKVQKFKKIAQKNIDLYYFFLKCCLKSSVGIKTYFVVHKHVLKSVGNSFKLCNSVDLETALHPCRSRQMLYCPSVHNVIRKT